MRYPVDTIANVDDFVACDANKLIREYATSTGSLPWQELSRDARTFVERGQFAQGKIIWLLADICSMQLKPDSATQPFVFGCLWEGRRSAGPDDFIESDIELLRSLKSEIEHPALRARVHDLLWFLSKPRDFKDAKAAIEGYSQIDIQPDTWRSEVDVCVHRAIVLSKSLGKGAVIDLEKLKINLFSAFNITSLQDRYFALDLSKRLILCELDDDELVHVAEKLKDIGVKAKSQSDEEIAREYFQEAIGCFEALEIDIQKYNLQIEVAETWIRQAESLKGTNNSGNIGALPAYQNALYELRKIPRQVRDERGLTERVDQVRKYVESAGVGALDEMMSVSSDAIDISDHVRQTKKAFSGLTLEEGLGRLANISKFASRSEAEKSARQLASEFPIQRLFGSTHISSDGRVIAKTDGDFDRDVDGNDILADMIRSHQIHVDLTVKARIWPALSRLRAEHRLTLDYLHDICQRSPIVPPSRALMVAESLLAGFEDQWSLALHQLIPQLENILRFHLKRAGEKTTVIDDRGIENEVGMSALVERLILKEIFGEDFVFELKAIFTSPFGPNLRNEVAHGLIEHGTCYSAHSIYAWWLILRIVHNTYANLASDNGTGR